MTPRPYFGETQDIQKQSHPKEKWRYLIRLELVCYSDNKAAIASFALHCSID